MIFFINFALKCKDTDAYGSNTLMNLYTTDCYLLQR